MMMLLHGVAAKVLAQGPLTPTVATLDPSPVLAGTSDFTMTVTGTHFISTSKLQWNRKNRATGVGSATQLVTVIPAFGKFRLTVPFTVQGDVNAIQSVSVSLTNQEGKSQPMEQSLQ